MLSGNEDTLGVQKFKANDSGFLQDNGVESFFVSVEDWDSQMSNLASGGGSAGKPTGKISDLTAKYEPKYADEILPFDITVSFNIAEALDSDVQMIIL